MDIKEEHKIEEEVEIIFSNEDFHNTLKWCLNKKFIIKEFYIDGNVLLDFSKMKTYIRINKIKSILNE